MRALAPLLLLAAAALAEETRVVRDSAGRIEMTLPVSWEDQPLEDGQVIHAYAKNTGGHVLIVVREAGQADVDKQRDRYMAHDAESHPGAEFSKIADPFFGYRMNAQDKNRVLLRAFLRDGADGIVATVSSRFHGYDRAYAMRTIEAMGTLRLAPSEEPKAEAAAPAEPSRRIFDPHGLFSFVAPVAPWKTLTPEEDEILAFGLKGSRTTAALRILPEGDGFDPVLVLITLQGQLKRDYASCTADRVAAEPPALLVKNRKEGWVDYIVAFAACGKVFTLRLEAREGAFDGLKSVANTTAKSLVSMGQAYREPSDLPGDAVGDGKKGFVVHAAAEDAAAAGRAAEEVAPFEKDWGRIAPVYDRKAAPLHILLASPAAFADTAHGFGEVPAAYDRAACTVVAVPPPAGKEEHERWRARLYAALAEAALHRDLPFAPPWLLAGLTACMDAAGRTDGGPGAKHAAFLPLLDQDKASLDQVLAYSYRDVLEGETPLPAAMSWGYLHLMLFGKGPARGVYAKWARELAKAEKTAPAFDPGKVDMQAELKKHLERDLRK
ncbi:MAG TPA: hypothetical protein VFY93_07215 [Planctomycetota bacterium]|nr:hypothetical protein [Planctomycetota bacterium]